MIFDKTDADLSFIPLAFQIDIIDHMTPKSFWSFLFFIYLYVSESQIYVSPTAASDSQESYRVHSQNHWTPTVI